MATDRTILERLLRVEVAEKLLPGRQKYVVPPGAASPDISLWREVDSGEKK